MRRKTPNAQVIVSMIKERFSQDDILKSTGLSYIVKYIHQDAKAARKWVYENLKTFSNNNEAFIDAANQRFR